MLVIESATANLIADLQAARRQSDKLFGVIKPESLFDRPIAQRHRVIFYIGHLDGFDSIQICREGLGIESPDPDLDVLFQAGIDPDSAHLPSDLPSDWPSLNQVRQYVTRCREHVDKFLERAPEELVLLAVEHRLMHLETLAYMFHNFDLNTKQRPLEYSVHVTPGREVANSWVDIPAGSATLGKAHDGAFGWDNEYDVNVRSVDAFRTQRYSITNGEYLRFVQAGASTPYFWKTNGNSILLRGMFEEFPLPLDWPVYVTHDEAVAYAKWAGKSLPSEEQFHRAAYGTPDGFERQYPWGESQPDRAYGNFDFHRWDPEPVDANPLGQSAFGVEQLVGNGWQWTSTAFAPFPGFKARDSYPGYSANFFDNEHYVMKGGSAQTASRLLRRSFRNWFRHDYPYMFATFRCVEN